MTRPGKFSGYFVAAVMLTAGTIGLAYAQTTTSKPATAVQEFTHQEVQAANIVATLNDLSKQGWDVFQVIPGWTIKNDDGTTELVPKSYQVFARRPVAGK